MYMCVNKRAELTQQGTALKKIYLSALIYFYYYNFFSFLKHVFIQVIYLHA